MKKLVGLFIGLLLLLVSTAALAYTTPVMRVVNCKEYVSLREQPDSKSKRLKKVHLGEFVIECFDAENGFTLCTFDDRTGYIQSQYLATTSYYITDDIMMNQMVINCSESVQMYGSADKSSYKVTKVPLGAIVTGCVGTGGDYIYCEYKNKSGYINKSNLKKANYSAGTPDSKVIASGAAYPALPDSMEVINCTDWVSLREKARASATRLAKVPLGASVTGCVQVADEWVYCKYGGMWGYVQIAYLKNNSYQTPYIPPTVVQPVTAKPTITVAPITNRQTGTTIAPITNRQTGTQRSFDTLPAMPSYADFTATGANILNYTSLEGINVLVQYTDQDKERIMAVCYDSAQNYLWSVRNECSYPLIEGRLTWAMIGGKITDPQLIIYVADKGLFSYSVKQYLEVRWMIRRTEVPEMNSATCNNVATDGTLYIASDNTLYCISEDGRLLWSATHNHQNIQWPSDIVINKSTVEVCYDSNASFDLYDTIVYDLQGNELYTATRPIV